METTSNWTDDVLDREAYAGLITNFLISQYEAQTKLAKKRHFVLNIDASWGYGKTFFLDHWAMDLEKSGYHVLKYNAWLHDFSQDPFISFINDFTNQLLSFSGGKHKQAFKKLKENSVKVAKSALPSLVSAISIATVGLPLGKLLVSKPEDSDVDDSIASGLGSIANAVIEEALKKENSRELVIAEFKKSVEELIKKLKVDTNRRLPLFVFVDELDRCRPQFSIELIECVKHIFDIEDLYFVFATDGRQLQASTKAIYGDGYDAEVYFKRIFHRECQLPEPDHYKFALMLGKEHNSAPIYQRCLIPDAVQQICRGQNPQNEQILAALFALFSKHFNLTLRDQEQCYSNLAFLLHARNQKTHVALALFLIIVWHKNKENFNLLVDLSIRNSTPTNDFLFQIGAKVDEIRDVKIPGPSTAHYPIRELYTTYFRWIGKRDSDVFDERFPENQNSISSQILILLKQEMGNSINRNNSVSLGLEDYFNQIRLLSKP